MKIFRYLIVISLFLALGCADKIAKNAVSLEVKFSWKKTSKCSNKSPKIKVTNIPKNTVLLKVELTDLDVPSYNHGGGSLKYTGSGIIPAGALKSYTGPCPPSGSHRYRFTVKAVNKEGIVIGIGKAVKKFP